MNNTNWEKLIATLSKNDFYEPKVKFKFLDDIHEETGFSHVYWDEVIQDGFECIEYIEIDPIKKTYIGKLVKEKEEDFSTQLEKEIKKQNIPFSKVQQNFRVYGYTQN